MEIIRVIPSGFCKGVVNAIELAKKTRKENPSQKIYVLGMIVHNDFVTKELEKLNIITLDDTKKTKSEWIDEINDGIIIFTAHGIETKLKQKVINKGLKYVDASCEDVLKNKELIINYINNGYDVIYLGKKNHPESNAVLSESNKIHLITSIEDLRNICLSNNKLVLTCQTTMSKYELEEIIDLSKQKYPNIIIKNDICQATSSRQKAIMDIKDGDLLYIVGDVKSNNTNMLKKIGEKSIKKVRLIANYEDIDINDLENINKIYVSAGASTPTILINEVINYLKQYK